ncbi:hypothetical protein RhiXN_08875 [Rhizoctonia solani]|uniref:Uncharacterized protein n=1 Tax=Rhizoctonia solani TaxID=456999 RepID=A0A8H8NUR4_9AGAM|nr:uncharacterized protein RhiXN_08875 [Rhizoctonia solani]QRW19900.1 hypothetical protein RhiXN_08875 [Rhizoctonia solani]
MDLNVTSSDSDPAITGENESKAKAAEYDPAHSPERNNSLDAPCMVSPASKSTKYTEDKGYWPKLAQACELIDGAHLRQQEIERRWANDEFRSAWTEWIFGSKPATEEDWADFESALISIVLEGGIGPNELE